MGKAEPFCRMAYLERGFSWHVSGSSEDGLESLCSAARAHLSKMAFLVLFSCFPFLPTISTRRRSCQVITFESFRRNLYAFKAFWLGIGSHGAAVKKHILVKGCEYWRHRLRQKRTKMRTRKPCVALCGTHRLQVLYEDGKSVAV